MSKKWGKSEYWGLGPEYDPDFILTEAQKELRDNLIELCRNKIRPKSVECDQEYTYPRASLEALAELNLLSLTVPKELGGLGENHVCCVMVVETLARYGCPSTAMIYTMHLTACAMILFRHHNNDHLRDLLQRLNKDKLIGTSVHSDPSTGGHFWYPLSSKSKMITEDTLRVLKSGSWATSAGFADWYAIETVSPDIKTDFSDLSVFVIYKDEVRASTDDWSALGLHGNQSGPLLVDATIHLRRMVGPPGDGQNNNNEVGGIHFLLNSTACWNGISLACIDVAKKHVTRKSHADVGVRICDYPAIQDYFGKSICETNGCRSLLFMTAQQLDKVTDDCNWSIHEDLKAMPRAGYGFWLWQAKHNASENVSTVSDRMLRACGGTGYKTETGIERLLRDGKAGCLMAPTNEVIREFLGKASLIGMEALDLWEQSCNVRILNHEVSKMTIEAKKSLAEQLMKEIKLDESEKDVKTDIQDKDFDNPFNTTSPKYNSTNYKGEKDELHGPALKPCEYTSLTLNSKSDVTKSITSFIFNLPNETNHTGCYPGQYVQVKCKVDEKNHERYLSPVSPPDQFGRIEIIMKFETQGIVSNFFKNLNPGDSVEFRGPCGGFEYHPNTLDELTLIMSGAGVTPGLQLIRCITKNPKDKIKVNLFFFAETIQQMLGYEELMKHSEDPRINVIPSLGEPPENWEGSEGYINASLISENANVPVTEAHKVLLCGGPTMVISCLSSLKNLGFSSDSIYIYGQFGTSLVRSAYGKNAKLSTHISGHPLE